MDAVIIMWLVIGIVFGLIIGLSIVLLVLKGIASKNDKNQANMANAFSSLASEALEKNNTSFLQLAEQNMQIHQTKAENDLETRKKEVADLVKPLADQLGKIEKDRLESYVGLNQLVESMSKDQGNLQKETHNLVQALKAPQVRGRWGEITLRRVAELSGMAKYCDFDEQTNIDTESGRLRPDMVVNLPSNRKIIVDAKTPLNAYLESIEADSEEKRTESLKLHAKQVKDRVNELSGKAYWSALDYTPDFVVLFLPGEFFLGPAVEFDPNLVEHAMSNKVVIATPFTFIAILRAVEYGWREAQLAQSAQEISELGQEMYERLSTWTEHLVKMRRSLDQCVQHFNAGMSSLESRVLVSARRFKTRGISSSKDLPVLEPIDQIPRTPSAIASDD
jgi:DNA recombination protein RmuC